MQIKGVFYGVLAFGAIMALSINTEDVRVRRFSIMILAFCVGALASNPFFGSVDD